MASRFGPAHVSVRKMIEWIPNDGCLLVFNADHSNWRVAVSEKGAGLLRCHCAELGYDNPAVIGQKKRDLYITWKED
jgi:hypothetical protein